VTWIDGTGYVVSPLDGVNGVRRNLPAHSLSRFLRRTSSTISIRQFNRKSGLGFAVGTTGIRPSTCRLLWDDRLRRQRRESALLLRSLLDFASFGHAGLAYELHYIGLMPLYHRRDALIATLLAVGGAPASRQPNRT
jgi:hypothetical protein